MNNNTYSQKRRYIKELWDRAESTLRFIYGDMPPLPILERFYSEKRALYNTDAVILWNVLCNVSCEALERDCNTRIIGTGGSFLCAYLLGALLDNPLPLHYYCSSCKSIEFIDGKETLPFDMKRKACACGGVMLPDGFDLSYETNTGSATHVTLLVSPSFIDDAKAIAVEGLREYYRVGELSDGDGQKRLVLLPRDGGDDFADSITEKDKYDEYPSLTLKPHETFDLCERVARMTDSDFYEVYSSISADYLSDKRVISALAREVSFDARRVGGVASQTASVMYPSESAYEIMKLYGALHGTGTWRANAELLVSGGVRLSDIPTTRDDVFTLLRDRLGDREIGIAAELTDRIWRGELDANSRLLLDTLELPTWFTDYVERIKYMAPKSFVVSTLREALAVKWFSLRYPEEFQRALNDE